MSDDSRNAKEKAEQKAKEKAEQAVKEMAEIILARADLAVAAQIDGLRSMQTRMGTLLVQALTLTSISIAATITVVSAILRVDQATPAPVWAQAFVVPGLITLTILWVLAAGVAAISLQSIQWKNQGFYPDSLLKNPDFPDAAPAEARMALVKALQKALTGNDQTVERYRRRLAWTISLLMAGPILALAVIMIAILASDVLVAMAHSLLTACFAGPLATMGVDFAC